jgi:hypothetical protein
MAAAENSRILRVVALTAVVPQYLERAIFAASTELQRIVRLTGTMRRTGVGVHKASMAICSTIKSYNLLYLLSC